MSKFLDIEIKTLDNAGFQLYQTEFIRKVLEATIMDHLNGFKIPTMFAEPLSKGMNYPEAKIDWPYSYASVIGMMLYLE